MTGTLSAIGSVSASRSVRSEGFYCVLLFTLCGIFVFPALLIIVITPAASSRFSTSGTSEYFMSCCVLFCSVVQYLSLVCVHSSAL